LDMDMAIDRIRQTETELVEAERLVEGRNGR
jgi:hypothetical protein